jgi:hypothetical protein
MSTKLNAEGLAERRFKRDKTVSESLGYGPYREIAVLPAAMESYAAAITEVAQPIANERDELRKALEDMLYYIDEGIPIFDTSTPVKDAERILAKYPKP